MWDANHDPADHGENLGRGRSLKVRSTSSLNRMLAIACEVLARRIVYLAEPDRLRAIMSTRYRHRQVDGDVSEMSSALELAIDQHWSVENLRTTNSSLNSPF